MGVELRGAMRLAATLDGKREEARLYKQLATATDVPLPETLPELRWEGRNRRIPGPRGQLSALPQPPRFRDS